MELIEHGGWVLGAIFALSLMGWYLIARKWFRLRDLTGPGIPRGKDPLRGLIEQEPSGMRAACGRPPELLHGMILTVLDGLESGRGFTRKQRRALLKRETKRLRAHLPMISSIGAMLPLLGLLGTVLGMMKTFEALTDQRGLGMDSLMAGGVSEALITTQAGLVAALPIVLMYGILSSRIRRYMDGCALVMKRLESRFASEDDHV